MKVLILPSKTAAIARTARILLDQVKAKPECVLGLATGNTMLPLYEQLRSLHAQEQVSFAGVRTFNLDEYVGLSPDHPDSYHTYMHTHLFNHIDIDPSNVNLPNGDTADAAQAADAYEHRIEQLGGIDLQLLGIGANGHIGFNEPTSSLSSGTRVKTLTQNTRDANFATFTHSGSTPKYAITMGIGSILQAKSCVLLATGASKAQAVACAIEGPVTAICPASALQLHSQVTMVLDTAAAGDLQLKDYYHQVHPDGLKSELE